MLLTATPMRIVETKILLTFEVQANPNKVLRVPTWMVVELSKSAY